MPRASTPAERAYAREAFARVTALCETERRVATMDTNLNRLQQQVVALTRGVTNPGNGVTSKPTHTESAPQTVVLSQLETATLDRCVLMGLDHDRARSRIVDDRQRARTTSEPADDKLTAVEHEALTRCILMGVPKDRALARILRMRG